MVKHIQEEMILTQTADMFAEMDPKIWEEKNKKSFLKTGFLPSVISLPGAYQLVSVIMT